jgi:hypothetical protein
MPTTFLIGFYFDTDTVGTPTSRIMYTMTTLSLMFVLFQKLKMTETFSFMVICIIACLYKIFHFVLFLIVLMCFLSVSYTNLGYASPLKLKFNIYIANFFSMFKMAMGESQTDEIDDLDGAVYYGCWILFLFLMFFTTIVYMNILIAVVSDEFERVYEERRLALYKIRLSYIITMWQQLSNDKIKVDNFALVVPKTDESGDEWTGWISVVKKQISSMKNQLAEIME